MKFSKTVVFIGVLVAVQGCSKKTGIPEGGSQALRDTKNGSWEQPLRVRKEKKVLLEINKTTGMDHEFLLSSSMVQQNPILTSEGLVSRIVSFKLRDGKLVLLESSQGHLISEEDEKAELPLADFPILEEKEQSYIIDFNSGMNLVYTLENWTASDFDGKEYAPYARSYSMPIPSSYIKGAELKGDYLEVQQIAMVQTRGVARPPYEIRYYISPYRANKKFSVKENKSFRWTGFFEAPQKIEKGGREVAPVTRWDLSRPITYYVSANTPPEYVQAVKDGILYWNKSLGREILKAEVAPIGVSAPDPGYNLIQWVNWDNAPSSYADVLTDPVTGEVLHAQAYVTSAFAIESKEKAIELLRKMREKLKNAKMAQAKVKQKDESFGKHLCNRNELDQAKIMSEALGELIHKNVPSETFLQFAQNVIRSTVAHEVGHTLGLRHNFGGNLGSNVSVQEEKEDVKRYLLAGVSPPLSKVYTSSVMDYLRFELDYLVGGQIAEIVNESSEQGHVFSYDKLAMESLYLDREVHEQDLVNLPVFCTDSDASRDFGAAKYLDCRRFDHGHNPIEALAWETSHELETMPEKLVEEYIEGVTASDIRDFNEVSFVEPGSHEVIHRLNTYLDEKLKWMDHANRSLLIEKKFPYVGSVNEKLIQAKFDEFVSNSVSQLDVYEDPISFGGGTQVTVKRLDGIENYLLSVLPAMDRDHSYISEVAEQSLENLLTQDEFTQWIGKSGKTFSFSAGDIQKIRETGREHFWSVENNVIDYALTLIAKIEIKNEKIQERLAERLKVIVPTIVLVDSDLNVHFKFSNEKKVETPKLSSKLSAESFEHMPFSILSALKPLFRSPKEKSGKKEEVLAKDQEKKKTASLTQPNQLKKFRYSHEIRESALGLLKITLNKDLEGWQKPVSAALKETLTFLVLETIGDKVEVKDIDEKKIQSADARKWLREQKSILEKL